DLGIGDARGGDRVDDVRSYEEVLTEPLLRGQACPFEDPPRVGHGLSCSGGGETDAAVAFARCAIFRGLTPRPRMARSARDCEARTRRRTASRTTSSTLRSAPAARGSRLGSNAGMVQRTS